MTTPTPERCPLCGHEDGHIDKYCGGALSCICSQTEYLAALRGYHSRDAEVLAIVQCGFEWAARAEKAEVEIATLQADNAAKDRRIAELEGHLVRAHGCTDAEMFAERKERLRNG